MIRCSLTLVLTTSLAAQSTIRVPADQPTIQDGIAAAANGDTVLVAPGTYVEQVDLLGKAIHLLAEAGPTATAIDSQGAADWPDFPFGAVVRMNTGEIDTTIVEGFTITGGYTALGLAGHGGVVCVGLSPTIRRCHIVGNSGGVGGGVLGDAILEDCLIEGNDSMPYGQGGGVFGQPTMKRCVVRGNRSGGLGGGLYAAGPCNVTNCVFDQNIAGNGADGYSGGGVFGAATLSKCTIVRNQAHHYFAGGPADELGTGVDGAALLDRCTVADNRVVGGALPGDPSGGVRNCAAIRDSILWGNDGQDVALGSTTTTIVWSIVGSGWVGLGVTSADPLFRDLANGDVFLQTGSPCIDAADPLAPVDFDGTRRDQGALYFPQFLSSVVPRNGSGLNPLALSAPGGPVIAGTFSPALDTTAFPFSVGLAALYGTRNPGLTAPLPFGELLLDPSGPLLVAETVASPAATQIWVLPVPDDYALGGFQLGLQALAVGAGQLGLSNALDATLGL